VSGLDWDSCRGVIEKHVPSGVAQAIADADTFFGAELPALGAWEFGPTEAAAITQPVLSVKGSDTERLWVEVAALLRAWFPQVEELTIAGIGHLLQMQRSEPVARGLAEFLGRHPMATADIGASRARGQAASLAV
jgi:3-oxoadipate enol-lactonase